MSTNYQVHIKIKEGNGSGSHYEFHWMGEELRSPKQEIDLIIEGDNQEDVFDTVLAQSKDTLEIINIFTPEQETLDRVGKTPEPPEHEKILMELMHVVSPQEIREVSFKGPLSTSRN